VAIERHSSTTAQVTWNAFNLLALRAQQEATKNRTETVECVAAEIRTLETA
jgi:hypothetical protein